jgi:hypothetical protein
MLKALMGIRIETRRTAIMERGLRIRRAIHPFLKT